MNNDRSIQVGTKLSEKYGQRSAEVVKISNVEMRMNGRGGFSSKLVYTLKVNGENHPRVMDRSSLNCLWKIA